MTLWTKCGNLQSASVINLEIVNIYIIKLRDHEREVKRRGSLLSSTFRVGTS